jgi:hypothetical protein
VHPTETSMYRRADVERLAKHRAESKRRKRVADALRGKTR